MNLLVYTIISLLVLFLSYRLSLAKAFTVSILLSIFILLSGLKAVPYETLMYILFINLIPLFTRNFRKDFNRQKEALRLKFEEEKNSYEELIRKDRYEVDANLEKERSLQQILSLHEISKALSSSVTIDGLFNILSSFLKKYFRFKVLQLLLLKDSKDIEIIYHTEPGHNIKDVTPKDFDRELVCIVNETQKIISISPIEDSRYLRRLSIVKDFETLVAIPLFVEKKMCAILYIENILRKHFENFILLAELFAIYFQKVILYQKMEVGEREYFLGRFSEEMRRAMRRKSELSLFLLELDDFKETNYRFGYLVGDAILKEVRGILSSNLREIDIIDRLGGEEFVVVLAGTGRNDAFQVAERMRGVIEKAVFKPYGETVSTSVSIGVSVFPEDGANVDALIDSARRVLYKAKESGRNRVC